jgi:protein ImuA
VPSGFPQLDAQLPGGGWPRRVLTELLLPHPGVGEIRLLSGSLASIQQSGRLVMLFDPPQQLSAWALAQCGFDVKQLLVIHTRCKVVAGSDSLWALEQALKSGHVGAVLAWLPPRLRAERLRRLQLAAQAHDGPAFVLREMAAQQRPTAAPLRLALKPGGADTLNLRLLKRRGPPLESSLQLALPPVLSAAARQRAQQIHVPPPSSPVEDEVLHTATFINLAS